MDTNLKFARLVGGIIIIVDIILAYGKISWDGFSSYFDDISRILFSDFFDFFLSVQIFALPTGVIGWLLTKKWWWAVISWLLCIISLLNLVVVAPY